MHMKIGYDDRSYLLSKLPTTFAELSAGVIEKVKLPPGTQPAFYYVDNDGDMIVVADDADLANVKDVCRMEGKDLCKLIVDKPQAGSPRADADQRAGSCTQCNGFDSTKYFHFLKAKLPSFSEEFSECLNKGLPCEDCFGVGKAKDGSKCYNCYGRGIRPLNNQFKLMMQIMDFKIKEYIFEPLEIFVKSGGSSMDLPAKGMQSPFNQKASHSSIEEIIGKKETLAFPNSSLFGGPMKKENDNLSTVTENQKANIDD